jgi:hypothetical protein
MPILLQRCNLSEVFSDCTALDVFAIFPHMGVQIRRSWRRWNRHLMELLILNFSLLVHVLPGAQNFMRKAIIGSQDLVEAMLGFATPRGMAPLLSIQVS